MDKFESNGDAYVINARSKFDLIQFAFEGVMVIMRGNSSNSKRCLAQ